MQRWMCGGDAVLFCHYFSNLLFVFSRHLGTDEVLSLGSFVYTTGNESEPKIICENKFIHLKLQSEFC